MSVNQASQSGSPARLRPGRTRHMMIFLVFSTTLLTAGCTVDKPDSQTTGRDTTLSPDPDRAQDDRFGRFHDSTDTGLMREIPIDPDDPGDRIVQDHQNTTGNQAQDTTMNQQDYSHKLDAPLRNRIARSGQESNGDVHEILIQLTGTAGSEIIETLNGYRIEVRHVLGSIVTARGTAWAIQSAASDPAVISISLSTERQRND